MEAKKLRSMAVITMMLISLFSVKVSANQITNRQGDQLSLNLDETKETGLPTPAVQQGNGSNFGVPMHLLYEYLKIPLSYPNNRFRLLIVGGGLPINWTNLNTFQGRLTVTNLGATLLNDSEGRAASTGNEVEVLEYLLNNKFSLFPNLRVDWISINFGKVSSNLTYRVEVSQFILASNILDYDALLLLGGYDGDPLDEFNAAIRRYNRSDKIIVSNAMNLQAGGDLLSPGSNPDVITIGRLRENGQYLEAYLRPEKFSVELQSPLTANSRVKTNPDFVVPGNPILLSNTSSPNPDKHVSAIVESSYLHVATFVLGFLSLKSRFSSTLDTRQILNLIVDNSLMLPDGSFLGNQIGYGVPQFVATNTRYQKIRNLDINPFQDDSGIEIITSGQILYPIVEISPYITNATLSNIKISHSDQEITKTIEVESTAIFVDRLTDVPSTLGERNWLHPKIIATTFSVSGIPEDEIFEISFNFLFDGRNQSIVKKAIIDDHKKLVGFLTYLENDGLYKRESPEGKLFPVLRKLANEGWAISIMTNQSIMEREIEMLDHAVIAIVDPDVFSINDSIIFSDYLANQGNILFFSDYIPPFAILPRRDIEILQYNNLPNNLVDWMSTQGLDILPWEHKQNPALMKIRELGVPGNHPDFYLITWRYNNNSYFQNFTLVPFRGYRILNSNELDFYVSSELNTIIPFGSKFIGEGNLGMMGTIAPFVNAFEGSPVPLSDFDNVLWLDNILTMTSGAIGSIMINGVKGPDAFNEVSLELDVDRIFEKQDQRWQIRVSADFMDPVVFVVNSTDIKLTIPLTSSGSFNITVQLIFGNLVMDENVTLLSISRPLVIKIFIVILWAIMVVFGTFLFYVGRRLKVK